MRKTREKETQKVSITTNKVDYQINYQAFRNKYAIFRYRVNEDNRWYSAYHISRSMPEDVCLSVTARKENEGETNYTWYYMLVPAEKKEQVYECLDKENERNVDLFEFLIHEDSDTDNLILNLLLNTCTLSTDECRSHRDFGKLLLVREDSFLTDEKHRKKLGNDRLALEVSINRDFVMVASTVTFCPANVSTESDKKEKIPSHYYCFDHLQMTLYKELPEDWKERYDDGFVHFFKKGTSNPSVHHVIEQLNMNQTYLHLNKTAVIFQLRDSMNTCYAEVLDRFEFKTIESCDKLKTDYEKEAGHIARTILAGQYLRIEDTVDNEESKAFIEKLKQLMEQMMSKDKIPVLPISDGPEAGCVLRVVNVPEDNIPDNYHSFDRVEMTGQGVAVQHIQLKKEYNSEKTLKAALGRIVKEFTVKSIIASRSMMNEKLKNLYAGWSFAIAKKVDDGRLVDLMMHVDKDGNLYFGRTKPGDFIGRKGQKHACLLNAVQDDSLWQYFGLDNYTGQESYYLLSKGNNVYHIIYTSEQALPEYEALKEFYKVIRNLEQWDKDIIEDMIKSMVSYDDFLYEAVNEYKKYTVEDVRSLANTLKKQYPAISKMLLSFVDGYPFLSQVRNVDNVDTYFGGLVDIHCWLDGKMLKYVSSKSGKSLDNVKTLRYNGFPHIRAVALHTMMNEETVVSDFNDILQMLQAGFGKAHYATALPFGFKLLGEMCDVLCVTQYGMHWREMNPTSFKDWEGRFYKAKGILLDKINT